jgi:hypothetical protein
MKKIFSIPLTTFLGALSVIGMLWLLALSSIGISLQAWNVTVLWMLGGVLIYLYYFRKNEKRGISVAEIYGAIPPP